MLTKAHVQLEYWERHGRPMQDADYEALLRMMRAFDCEDAESYQEACEKIDASMASICEELESVETDTESNEIVTRRLAGFRRELL